MSTPALIVVLAVLLLTVLLLALCVIVAIRQFRALMRGLGALQTTVVPQLAALADEAAAAQTQLEALVVARDGATADGDSEPDAGGDAWSQGYTGIPQRPTAGARHG